MPHSRPTLIAVRTLSPVTMRVGMCAERNVAIAGAVPGLSLFSKMTRPRNRKSLSTASLRGYRCQSFGSVARAHRSSQTHRLSRCALIQVNPAMVLPASAITRKPRLV